MPEEATPVTRPVSNALSGGTWVSGPGFTQGSGTLVDYAEYKQWLTIVYSRKPNATSKSTADHRSLESFSAIDTHNVYNTNLHFNITVHNSCTKLIGDYSTSTVHQPQKFQIQANAVDQYGYSYGSWAQGSDSAFMFGPQGQIVTTQPYVYRRIWKTTDVEYSLTQVGDSHGAQIVSYPDVGILGVFDWGPGDVSDPYKQHIDIRYYDVADASPLGRDTPPGLGTAAPTYPHTKKQTPSDTYQMFGGPYSVSSEVAFSDNAAGLTRMITFIETNCAILQQPYFAQRYPILNPTNSDGFYNIQEADRLAINPYYSTAFHDYT